MEIRQTVTRVPNQQTVLLAAILFVLALGLVGWRVLALNAVPNVGANHGAAAMTSSQAPDAQERNAQLRIAQIKEDATHGH